MLAVLVFAKYYVPAYKAGGPIRSIENMVAHLGDEFQFFIISQDRDFQDSAAFSGVEVDTWNDVGKAKVYYVSPNQWSLPGLKGATRGLSFDLLYVNSLFQPLFGIYPLLRWRLSHFGDVPMLLAPRGELSPGALSLKSTKKKLYLSLFRQFSIHRRVVWHASTEQEVRHIREAMGERVTVLTARNLPSTMENAVANPDLVDDSRINIAFLSRVVPKKNLDYALRIIKSLDVDVTFRIYGPIADSSYWQECRRIISGMPSNVHVSYEGAIPHREVGTVFASHDLFLFPTRGENYGHVIFEALMSGCPVLISDQTPWQSLQKKGAGWVVALDDFDRFRSVIRTVANADPRTYKGWSNSARQVALAELNDSGVITHNRDLVRQAIECT